MRRFKVGASASGIVSASVSGSASGSASRVRMTVDLAHRPPAGEVSGERASMSVVASEGKGAAMMPVLKVCSANAHVANKVDDPGSIMSEMRLLYVEVEILIVRRS